MKTWLFFVTLSLALGAIHSPANTAAAEPETVNVSVTATDPISSESGRSTGLFTIHRSGPTTADLTVLYKVSGSAVAPGDYNSLPGSIIIPAGSASATILVTPVDDSIAEDSETVVLTIVSPVRPAAAATAAPAAPLYAVGRPSSASVTIRDNDLGIVTQPTVMIRATDPKAAEPGSIGKFTVTRLGSTADSLTVSYDVVTAPISLDSTDEPTPSSDAPTVLIPAATGGVDYQTLPGSVTIPAGKKSVTITVQPIDDQTVEGREHVTLKLKAGNAYAINEPDTATVLIADDDPVIPPPTVTVTATQPDVLESDISNPGVFKVTRTGATDTKLNVHYMIGGKARNGVDYSKLPTVVTIQPGESSGLIKVVPYPDKALEGNETVVLTLIQRVFATSLVKPSPEENYTVGDPKSATVTIHDVTPTSTTQSTLVIDSPKDGATFQAPADITVSATAIDPKGYISRVDFYANDTFIGTSRIFFFRAPDPGTPVQHSVEWKKAAAGKYSLAVKATDSSGAVVVSQPVTITVNAGVGPMNIGVQKLNSAEARRLTFSGEPGRRYSIQVSSDLREWTEVDTVTSSGDTFEFVDPDGSEAAHRFYRAVDLSE